MLSEWAEIESLMSELGAVRAAAFGVTGSEAAYAEIEQAISKATQAVVNAVDDPRNEDERGRARQAIVTARELVLSLTAEIDRARRARERAAELGVVRPPRRDGGR